MNVWGYFRDRRFTTLFGTDLWERFSFYGMQALLFLYAVAPRSTGGLGLDVGAGGALFGLYVAGVFLAAVPGGWLGDRILGPRKALRLGLVLIALGHYCLAVPARASFVPGLVLIAAGTGLVKPNLPVMFTTLYPDAPPAQRDASFAVFYLSSQVSALIAPIVTGFLGERVTWHLGFGAAAVGMTVGLVWYTVGARRFGPQRYRPAPRVRVRVPRDYLWVLVPSALFWLLFSQLGSSFAYFARDHTDRRVLGYLVPASWFQSAHPLFLLLVAPASAWLWLRLGSRVPGLAKLAAGLLASGVGFLVMAYAATLSGTETRVSPAWLLLAFLAQALGEVSFGPVGLSLTAQAAPPGYAGRLMGRYFLGAALGAGLGGQYARLLPVLPLPWYFGILAAAALAVAALLARRARHVEPVSRPAQVPVATLALAQSPNP